MFDASLIGRFHIRNNDPKYIFNDLIYIQMEDKDSIPLNAMISKLEEVSISSENVFNGNLLNVNVDKVRLPDGNTSTRDWIRHPGASAIVPVFDDGTIMLVHQYRFPPRELFLEVPAGKLDPGESPEKTALRELKEECGISCKSIHKTGEFYPAIGYSDEIIHIYAAWNLDLQEQKADDDEFLINHRIAFSKALSLIDTGVINDGKTICALIKTYMWWKKNEPFKINFQNSF